MKQTEQESGSVRLLTVFSEYFGMSRAMSLAALVFITVLSCLAVFWFIHSAPPREIVMTSGPAGSIFDRNAEKYRAILATNGVTLKIVPSQGSLENLRRLLDPASKVDVGFVQGGVAGGLSLEKVVSLGSVAYEPLLVFYRGATPVTMLSQLAGKRLAVGTEGSGTHELAMTLLQTNGIVPGGATTLEAMDADDGAKGLLSGTIDAVFLMSDSASIQTLRELLRAPDVHLMGFAQADAYMRRFNFLNKMLLPQGAIDFGKNQPAQDLWLIGPTVELVARPDLNPAVSDLLLEAAREVHGNAGMFQHRAEFPAPLVHEYNISADAARYYKSGKTFLYREMPFWLASLANRILVAFVPLLLVLVPGLRLLPAVYRWRGQLRIFRWYRKLLMLEREVSADLPPEKRQELAARLDEIERVVRQMKVPASFAYLFYSLREHIDYVRARLGQR
jgi:TRAP-type uncharacterized transport system substrate-binding protein